MEDLYKDDPNSWLRCTHFSKTVYHQPNPLQISIIPLTKPKLGPSNPNSNRESISVPVTLDSTSKTTRTTGEVQVESDSKTKKDNLASMNGAISNMFKEAKNTVRSPFQGPWHKERTVKSSSSQKEKSCWMKKYFDSGVRQVSALDKCSEDDWTPDMSELIWWKRMASRVCCNMLAGPPDSGIED